MSEGKNATFEKRPWGSFTVLEDAETHKVKTIRVEPGQRLSYQQHARRGEHWFIVEGQATVTLNDVEHRLGPGDAIDIALGAWHRMENRGDTPVVFVEVQRGDYFGEDDIVRASDDYGRAG
jgi:mannose-6-phosphate isomerase